MTRLGRPCLDAIAEVRGNALRILARNRMTRPPCTLREIPALAHVAMQLIHKCEQWEAQA